MGDVQGWVALSASNGGGDYNGALSPPLAQPAPNPHPSAIAAESWRQAETGTQEIIERIQPTLVSEQRRRAVVEYVQNLLRDVLGIQVLPFGSVPLKTYLPDGDIDLTALAIPNSEDTLAGDLRSVLGVEEQNKDAEFEVKDVQYIHAEVRLVKCLVQNIVVDISFNQIGGLCTLCFLEQVDCLIGKSNLFKRSIILIKAWCYYESRILGAHHALISTYALETLVLYIFHLFHSSLNGPLAVLYRFLDYYSKFDWDNYCISLYGPISISSLPELVAEVPETDGGDLLLSKDFIRNYVEMFSDSPRGIENHSRSFPQKHLNIVDPLKENNNLGRSVSKGNFYRIRSAFTYGAQKLGHILSLPADRIANEVNKFFTNTMDRHGSGERPDVQGMGSTIANHNVIDPVPSELKVEKSREDKLIVRKLATNSHGALRNGINNLKISGLDMEQGTGMQLRKHPFNKQLDATWMNKRSQLETNVPVEGNVISSRRLAGDAGDLARIRSSGSKEIGEPFKDTLPHSDVVSSQSGKPYHAPHLFFHSDNRITPRDSTPSKESSIFVHTDSYENELSPSSTCYSNHGISAPGISVDGSLSSSWSTNRAEYLQPAEIEGIGSNGSPMPNQLADLSGDYDMHHTSLLYAQQFRACMWGTQYLPIHQSSHSQYQNKYSWDPVRRRNIYMNSNGVVPRPPFSPGYYPMIPPMIPGAYSMEDMPKPRGTGTYFPNTRAYGEKHSSGRGRNPTAGNQLQRSCSNGWSETAQDPNFREKGDQDVPSQELVKASGNGRGKPAHLDVHKPPFSSSKSFSNAIGFLFPPSKVEFGSLGPVSVGPSNPEVSRRSDSVSSHGQGSGPSSVPSSPVQRSVTSFNTERPRQSYQLKNDDDFPPLTG